MWARIFHKPDRSARLNIDLQTNKGSPSGEIGCLPVDLFPEAGERRIAGVGELPIWARGETANEPVNRQQSQQRCESRYGPVEHCGVAQIDLVAELFFVNGNDFGVGHASLLHLEDSYLGGRAKTTAALGHGAGDTFFATTLAGNVRTDAIDIIALDLGSLAGSRKNQKQGENAKF